MEAGGASETNQAPQVSKGQGLWGWSRVGGGVFEKPHQSPKPYLVPPFFWGSCGQRWIWGFSGNVHTF